MGAMSSDRPPLSGILIVLVAATLFGTLGPVANLAYDAGMQPLPFVIWRGGIGLLAAGAFVAWRVWRGAERLTRPGDLDASARRSLLAAALLGFSLNLAMFISFDLVTVALALLGFYTYPVMVALASVALGREHLDRTRVAALALAVAGMVLVVASQLDPAAGIRIDAIGIGLALAAAASQAAFVIIGRTGFPTVPASQAMSTVLAMTVVCGTALAVVTGTSAGLAEPFRQPDLWPLLLFTGLFAAGVPSIMFLTGLRRVGGTRAGILMLFEPVVGVVLAAILLGERLTPIQVVGGLLVLAAALLLQRGATPGGRAVAAPAIEADIADDPDLERRATAPADGAPTHSPAPGPVDRSPVGAPERP
jgi:drug/metabolite transporter (DMT)-like permease